jgi:hypothetical protein
MPVAVSRREEISSFLKCPGKKSLEEEAKEINLRQ